MAGAGYKLYLTGDVLSATDVNNYIQEQTVMVFASSGARTSALSLVLAEGMVSYLQDTNATQVYNGTAWVTLAASPLTTKGDLYGFSTVDARIPIGTNNQVLTADSAQALGLKWATPAGGGGKVLQVVQATTTTGVSVSSTTMTDSGLTVTITPTLNTSKVLILVSQQLQISRGASTVAQGGWRLLRGATEIFDGNGTNSRAFNLATMPTEAYIAGYYALNYLDSPATTSATTYKTQIKVATTASGGNITAQESSATSSIIALEIGA